MAYLPILTYHRLLPGRPTRDADPHRISVSQEQFRRHLAWLKRLRYQTLRLPDYVQLLRQKAAIPKRAMAITFDDGYEEVFTLALPVLQTFGFSATVFAVPAEETNQWDSGRARLMSPDQLRAWRQAGMDVGAHSSHHKHLPKIPIPDAARELSDSKSALEKILDHPVRLLAYPYGETNDAVDALAREAGFEAAFATDHASGNHSDNLYRLRRAVVFPRNNAWEILLKVQPWYPAFQDWKRQGK